MLDAGCLILEKSFTAENAEKRAKSTDFDCKFCDFMSQLTFLLYFGCMDLAESETKKRLQVVTHSPYFINNTQC